MARFFESWWTHLATTTSARNAKRKRSARPTVEALEDRTVPTITIDAAGLVSVVGTPHHDEFIIRFDPTISTQLQFSDDGGTSFTSFAATAVTAVDVTGLQGQDVLTIDNSFGLVGGTNLPISFDGGKGFDELVLSGNPGGAAITETYTVGTKSGTGMITVGNGALSSTITLTSVESIVDTLTASQLTINANDNPNLIKINDGPAIDGVQTTRVRIFDRVTEEKHGKGDDNNQGEDNHQGDDNNQGDEDGMGEDRHGDQSTVFTPIRFANKTNVTINSLGGNDVFILNNPHPAAGLAQLTLDGGAGQNTVIERNVPSGVTLNLMNIQNVVTNPEDALIDETFEEDLGREADPEGLKAWKTGLDQGLGVGAVVSGIENSAEARTLFVDRLYVKFLGRSAVNGEDQAWVKALLQGASEEEVTSDIVGSAEFQLRAQSVGGAGSAEERTVQALYNALLGRTASAAEAAGWVNILPMTGARVIAMGFLNSAEFRSQVVDTTYVSLLGRNADQAGLTSWVNSNLDLHTIRQGIERSPEFALNE